MHRLAWGGVAGLLVLSAVAASTVAQAQSAFFRIDDLDLRDPHVFVSAFGSCLDVTSSAVFGFPSINGEIQDSIRTDADGDGLLDQSILVEFLPLDRTLALNLMDSGSADCAAPLAATICSEITASALAGDAVLSTASACLATLAGTVAHIYAPAVTNANAPCFSSPTGTFAFDVGGIPIQLSDAQLAARFVGDPATGIDSGLLRGFLSETDADNTTIPAGVPVVGGLPLSALLPGGQGSCAAHSDMDVHNGIAGWWFYFNFTAPRLAVAPDNFGTGFADGFEP